MNGLGFFLYLLFTVSWFARLTSRLEFLGTIRFDLLLIALTLGCLILSGRYEGPEAGRKMNKRLMLLFAYIVATIPLVYWPGSVIRNGIPEFVKAVVFFFFSRGFLTTENRLQTFITVFLSCQALRVVEPVYLHVTQGYWGSVAHLQGEEFLSRLSGGPHDVINPNGLAFVIISAFPFLHYLSSTSARRRLMYVGLLPVFLYALMLTGSRSGLIGFAVAIFGVFLKSRRKLVLGVLIFIGGVAALGRLSTDLQDRYTSIYSKDTKNAGTAEGRIEGVKRNFRSVAHRPIFGHGLGTSYETGANFGGRAQIAHNLIAEVSQELGLVGLVFFLMYLHALWRSVYRDDDGAESAIRSDRYFSALRNALQVWLATNLVFSFASYGLSGYDWYLFGGVSLALNRLALRRRGTAQEKIRRAVPLEKIMNEPKPAFAPAGI